MCSICNGFFFFYLSNSVLVILLALLDNENISVHADFYFQKILVFNLEQKLPISLNCPLHQNPVQL